MKLQKLILTGLALLAIAVPVLAAPDMTINIGADAVLFRENGGIQIWTPDENAVDGWSMALNITADDAAALTEDVTLDEALEPSDVAATDVVVEADTITVELLNNGQWQVSIGPDFEGKTTVVILESDFTFAREYTWSVYSTLDVVS